jgi:hypothetical protein
LNTNYRAAIRLHGIESPFYVRDIQRDTAVRSEREPLGKWQHAFETTDQRVLCCPETPDALYKWLDEHIDVGGLVAEASRHEFVEPEVFGFFVFVEIIK